MQPSSLMLIRDVGPSFYIIHLNVEAETAALMADEVMGFFNFKEPELVKVVDNTEKNLALLEKLSKAEVEISKAGKKQKFMLIFFGLPPYITHEDGLLRKHEFPLGFRVFSDRNGLNKTVADAMAEFLENGKVPSRWACLPYTNEAVLYFKAKASKFIDDTNICLVCESEKDCRKCKNSYCAEYAEALYRKGIHNLAFTEEKM